MITFFLPISRCAVGKVTVYEQPPVLIGSEIIKEDRPIQNTESTQGDNNAGYNYPYKWTALDELDYWVNFLSFFWPIPILTYCWVGKKHKIITSLKFAEPFLCLGSSYIIASLSFFGEIMYGGYLALASITSYFIASCIDTLFTIRNMIKDKRRTSV